MGAGRGAPEGVRGGGGGGEGVGRWGLGAGGVEPETLYHRDNALSNKPLMHYQSKVYLCY